MNKYQKSLAVLALIGNMGYTEATSLKQFNGFDDWADEPDYK
jgi:hypothetical protein